MKKFAIAAVAAAGLFTLGACGEKTPAAANLEAASDNMEDMADNATTVAGEQALENGADNLEAMADNASDDTATAANLAAGNAM